MSPLWLIPGFVVLLGSALVLALVRSAGEEARLLASELQRQREVGEAVRGLAGSLRTLKGPQRRPR
ncbi:MAG TPA: hypothetical protein VM262_09910 [Acidimicrobiales bacterium]|nr:hypothetical protein [Acidimicrobiales bacterium]